MIKLDPWVANVLANPVTKLPASLDSFAVVNGVPDARVFLRNTYGYDGWAEGQDEYESWANSDRTVEVGYRREMENDRCIYEHFKLTGRVLDCGGGSGIVREFLSEEVEYVSTDPWLGAPFSNSAERKKVYTCLSKPLNFVAATAEFQPFLGESFDWVHMRSMLDHVQVPDLALLEAYRVLRSGGHLLIGLYVEGGKSGAISLERRIKDAIKAGLGFFGVERWKDHHVWHPTYDSLINLIKDNKFSVDDTYWQPSYRDSVCYVLARKV